ncbi:MAG: fibronectin type III domain-containing protein, partial [Saprospiraceae bacterium]|nr:fibronectin type III domain-containing protein [Saprospiraceae bacterium]
STNGNGGGGSGSGTCAVPAQLSVVVTGGVATLSWSAVPGATQYYIEVEDEQNQPSNFHLELAVQDTFYVFNTLQTGVLYKFKVRTHCSGNQSDWSAWLFFNGNSSGGPSSGSGSCDRPTFLQITNLTLNSALLTWNPAPGITAYTLEIEKESPGAPWQTTQIVNTNSYQVNGLEPNTRYKYKVRSNCPGGGHSNWTKWKKFKTPNSFNGTAGGAGLTNNKEVEERELVTNNTSAIDMAMRLFPNPSSTEATLTFEAAQDGEATIRVFDMAGMLIWNQTVQAISGSTNTLQLSPVHFHNGCYLVQVRAGAQTQLMKWVVAQ